MPQDAATNPRRSPGAQALVTQGQSNIESIVSGGDDYEVLCAIPENRWDSFASAAARANVQIADIGRVESGAAAPRFLDAKGQSVALKRLSYSHF